MHKLLGMSSSRKTTKTRPTEHARGTCARAHGHVTRITAYLPPPLARSVRVRAAEEGRTVSAVVSDALELAQRTAD
jgi:hypothetical protein